MRPDQAAAETDRRLAGLVRFGTIASVDPNGARAQVDIGGVNTSPMPWLVQRAGAGRSWWAPTEGEQVVVLAPDGELGAAVILGSLYQASAPAPSDDPDVAVDVYADGAVIEYDASAHRLRADLPAGGTVVLVAPAGVTVEGDLAVDGDVSATGDVADGDGSLAAHRATFDLHGHPYQAPSGPAVTSTPTPAPPPEE